MDQEEKIAKLKQVAEVHLLEVYRVGLYLVKDGDLAEVVTKKAFMKLYKNIDDLKENLYLAYLVRCIQEQANRQ